MKRYGKRVLLLIIAGAVAYAVYRVFFIPGPQISGYEDLGKLPKEKRVVITVRNTHAVERFYAAVIQGLRRVTLIDERNIGKEKTYDLSIEPRKLGIADGEATVYISAESGIFSKTQIEIESVVDTVPPEIKQISSTPYVRQGSAGAVRVRAIGAEKVYLRIGNETYPLLPSPETGKQNIYRSVFPVRPSVKPGTRIVVVAEDDDENVRSAALDTTITKTSFMERKIEVTEEFVRKHIYPMLGEEGEGLPPTEAIRQINEVWREEDREVLKQLAGETSNRFLWEGKFRQLKNSQVFATYGDVRQYYYDGEPVTKSSHMGYDLASVRNAPVAAANSGRVVYAGQRRIYGNTVVIDHGLGLMSLYGHLSNITVSEGQDVGKGEVIGNTGKTGFAMGDHLHFAILVHGVGVNPLAWWDMNWIQNKILNVFL